MTTLLAFDVATSTGWAKARPVGGKLHRVACGTFKPTGNTEAKVFARFHDWILRLLEAERPDAVAIEQRLPSFARKSDLGGSMQIRNEGNVKRQDGLRALTLAAIGAVGVGYYEVNVQSWRAAFLPGMRPPPDVLKNKTRDWWKRQTLIRARELGDELGFQVPNADAGDAVGILSWLTAEWHKGERR